MSYAGEPPRFPATFFIHENFQNGVAGPTCPSSKSVAVEHEFLSTKWTGIHAQEVYFVQVTDYSSGYSGLSHAVIIPIGEVESVRTPGLGIVVLIERLENAFAPVSIGSALGSLPACS